MARAPDCVDRCKTDGQQQQDEGLLEADRAVFSTRRRIFEETSWRRPPIRDGVQRRTLPNAGAQSSDEVTEAPLQLMDLRCGMALAHAPLLFKTPPISFRFLVSDALLLLGLPYGPQAREQLAQALPALFGRSGATLSGYRRWLARNARQDTLDNFADFMEARYQRWLLTTTDRN